MEKRSGTQWGVIIGVIVLIFASVLFASRDSGQRTDAPAGSTYSTEPDGLSAIYAVLEKNEVARRWERQPDRLPASVDRLVIWTPYDIDSDNWAKVLDWVQEGHTLIIAMDSYRAPGAVHNGNEGPAAPAAVHPATKGLGQISAGPASFGTMQVGAQALLTKPDGSPVLVTYPQGKGRIYWSADVEWLTNARIAADGNLDLALHLLAPGDGKQTAFSEFHHGFEAADAWWQMLRGSLQWFGLVLVLATVVLYWTYGARFGAPVPLAEQPSRLAVEYVYSMSQLYRRAGARPVVLKALYRTLTRDLGRLLGGLHGLSHADIAARTAERTGLPAERVQGALDQTDPRARLITEKELILLTQEVDAIQRSVHNAGFRDQQRPGTGAK